MGKTKIILGWNRNQWQLIVLWLLLIAFGLSKNVEDTMGVAFLTLPLVIVAICAFASDSRADEPNYERLAVIDEIHKMSWKIIELEAENERLLGLHKELKSYLDGWRAASVDDKERRKQVIREPEAIVAEALGGE